ncbi:hypothetical protein CMI37_17060 [Candidatus Pacearchaeota archaeon]|nr:hypothetical protein [Candidatus Pacearchaeota archaeon]
MVEGGWERSDAKNLRFLDRICEAQTGSWRTEPPILRLAFVRDFNFPPSCCAVKGGKSKPRPNQENANFISSLLHFVGGG